MSREERRNHDRQLVVEQFKDWITMLRAYGYSMKEIADMLYESCEISYIERDLLKESESEE